MSNWREQIAQEEEAQEAIEWLTRYYHYPVLVFLVVFAFWNRVRNYSNFIVDGEVFYAGNDPWYHMRETQYATQNYLSTMPFDPFTNFPEGTFASQFGTIFDQLIALVALIVGLGNPDQYTTEVVILVAPAFFGVAVAIPAYFIGRRLGGRLAGIIAVSFIALAPDRLLEVSLAGNVQHHSMEVLMMGLTLLGFMVALTAAEREKPVYELLAAGEFDVLRGTVGWSMLAGVALGVYLWAWPPGLWMYGILGLFFVVFMGLEHARGRSPEHAAIVGVIAFSTSVLMQLLVVRELTLSATDRSILHPGLGLVVVLGIVFLAWLSREFEARDLRPSLYPVGVAGSIVGGLVLMALLLPSIFGFFLGEFDRVFGVVFSWIDGLLGTGLHDRGAAATIGEGAPGEVDDIFDFYRFAAGTAFLGALLILARQFLDEDRSGVELMFLVWSVFMVLATLTQIRFGYYLVLVVGAMNALLVGYVVKLVGTPSRDSLPETYHILVFLVIIFVMFVPMLGLPLVGGGETAVDISDGASQPGDVMGWADSLDWMSENTPEPGLYANPDGEAMELYGEYTLTDDYDYPAGAYGVLSWWDYGHWITGQGERIPNANPFQHHANEAADVLLAQDEDEALEQLSQLDDHEDAQTRYVMVDSLMVETETAVGGKFFAPADFHDEYQRSDFYRTVFIDDQPVTTTQKQAYYDAFMVQLYHYHGSAQDPEIATGQTIPGLDEDHPTLVMEWIGEEQLFQQEGLENEAFVEASEDQEENPLLRFEDNLTAAQEAVEDDPTSQIGGVGAHPEERVEALEHFRLVNMDEVPADFRYAQYSGDEEGLTAWEQAVERGMNPFLHSPTETHASLVANADNNPLADQPDGQQLNQQQLAQQHHLDLYETTPAFTKTFERVDGGTIEGAIDLNESADSVPEEATLQATMVPENGEQFEYTQHVDLNEDGSFEATVPYSTTGYDEWGLDEGYTNVSVRGDGPYSITTETFEVDGEEYEYRGDVNVTEGQVLGEDPEPAEVTLEQAEPIDLDDIFGDLPEEGEDETDDDETEDGEADDETEDGEADDETEDGEADDDEGTEDSETSDEETGDEETGDEETGGDETDAGVGSAVDAQTSAMPKAGAD